MQSSDAKKNVPFVVAGEDAQGRPVQLLVNREYLAEPDSASLAFPPQIQSLIQIPKSEISSVGVGTYAVSELVQHMPLVSARCSFLAHVSFRQLSDFALSCFAH